MVKQLWHIRGWKPPMLLMLREVKANYKADDAVPVHHEWMRGAMQGLDEERRRREGEGRSERRRPVVK